MTCRIVIVFGFILFCFKEQFLVIFNNPLNINITNGNFLIEEIT